MHNRAFQNRLDLFDISNYYLTTETWADNPKSLEEMIGLVSSRHSHATASNYLEFNRLFKYLINSLKSHRKYAVKSFMLKLHERSLCLDIYFKDPFSSRSKAAKRSSAGLMSLVLKSLAFTKRSSHFSSKMSAFLSMNEFI